DLIAVVDVVRQGDSGDAGAHGAGRGAVLRRKVLVEPAGVEQPQHLPGGALEEDDLTGHVHQRPPPESVGVEAPRGVEVPRREGDEVDPPVHGTGRYAVAAASGGVSAVRDTVCATAMPWAASASEPSARISCSSASQVSRRTERMPRSASIWAARCRSSRVGAGGSAGAAGSAASTAKDANVCTRPSPCAPSPRR